MKIALYDIFAGILLHGQMAETKIDVFNIERVIKYRRSISK